MGIDKKTFVICDRCGKSIEVDDTVSLFDVSRSHEGWTRANADRILCPECSPGYELLLARHKVELEDYMSSNAG